jgi:hypothetical protein
MDVGSSPTGPTKLNWNVEPFGLKHVSFDCISDRFYTDDPTNQIVFEFLWEILHVGLHESPKFEFL